jgi:hypothetical protein
MRIPQGLKCKRAMMDETKGGMGGKSTGDGLMSIERRGKKERNKAWREQLAQKSECRAMGLLF